MIFVQPLLDMAHGIRGFTCDNVPILLQGFYVNLHDDKRYFKATVAYHIKHTISFMCRIAKGNASFTNKKKHTTRAGRFSAHPKETKVYFRSVGGSLGGIAWKEVGFY